MDHVAIMKKSWGLLPKILTREKIIESRWYKTKHKPWNCVKPGDTIYFKNSGEPITVKTKVKKILQFENLTTYKIKQILKKYDLRLSYELFKDKKYCLLIFLENPKEVVPFNIDKRGFGAMSAWITVEDINKIKI